MGGIKAFHREEVQVWEWMDNKVSFFSMAVKYFHGWVYERNES